MKASTLLSALVVLVFFVSVSSGIRYTVNFSGLVGRLCGASGSGIPSGCPDSSPPFISGTPAPSFASINPSASRSPGSSLNPTASPGSSGVATATASPGSSGAFTASASALASGATRSPAASGASASAGASSGLSSSALPSGASASAGASSGLSSSALPSGASASSSSVQSSPIPSGCPVQSSCPINTCSPCICATPSSFPSFTRSASPTSAASNTANPTSTTTATRSISPSLTATPSPNPCGPQYEASTTNSFGVGLLFDRTTWARDNSNPAVYGALYAINQINAAGGIQIGGRNISLTPVFYDTQGLPNNTVAGANALTRTSCVSVVIGTENGAQRRAVQSLVLDSTAPSNAGPPLLLNPQNYNGLDVNAGVINFGANLLTNTRRAIDYAVASNKTQFFLLGSDDVDSRVINAYARQYITNTYPRVLIIGEDYIPVGGSEFTASQIFLAPQFLGATLFNTAFVNPCGRDARGNVLPCTLCLSSVYGQAANRILFQALAARYLNPTNPNLPYAVMSLRNSIYEFMNFSQSNVNNQFIGTNYLDSVDAVSNANIVSWKSGLVTFLQGANIINDSRINNTNGVELRSYNAIRLWANAVAAAGTANPAVIRSSILNATFNAPNGLVSVNATSREATTGTTPFYVALLTTPPLRPINVTVLQTTNDPFTLYPAPIGNLTNADSYSSLVSGIRNYYLGSQTSQILNISLGWEYPAIPSPTSKK